MVLENAIYPYKSLELVPSFQERPQVAVQPQPKQALVQLFECTSYLEDSPTSIVYPIEILSHNSKLSVNLYTLHYKQIKKQNSCGKKKNFLPV